ncbi:kinase-like domain-containing protein [Rhizophagus clarus]|uniref:Kinase-like domain-containing protein n=1 Tax=Rhizophagus clarus TaxID=94130 RepID=A0A8H3QZ46_9GLOM|nr:kinase-like domain-containing protein [Rhizophagus clarus]
METLNKLSKEKPKILWKNTKGYQWHVTISSTKLERIDNKIVYMEDLEKRKEVYGICGECNGPGTGRKWCQTCNAKRFRENFKNWTSGNKDIDELIQYSQLNAVYYTKFLEWIPFEHFKDVAYYTRGGFGKIYFADRPEGYITGWDIENQKWQRGTNTKVVLKSLDNSSEISIEFLNEIKSHIQVYFWGILQCYGITQDPDTKNYMMVLPYCEDGNLRNYYLNNHKEGIKKIYDLYRIANGLLDIHNSGKIHKDFHSGNLLLYGKNIYISDLGLCQSVNKNNDEKSDEEGVTGVLPYIAPEVLRGYQYTRAADIYSFGIIMNEYFSEEIPFNDIPHDECLAFKICKGLRPKIFEGTPKFLADLIMKCWDANAENRPTTTEVYEILGKRNEEKKKRNNEIHFQLKEYDKAIKNKLENESSKNSSEVHSHAIYTSRFLNFEQLSDTVPSVSANPECFDVQLSEADLLEIDKS